MAGDPTLTAKTHGRDLTAGDVQPRVAGPAFRSDVLGGKNEEKHLFEAVHKSAEIPARNGHDGVGDQLTWSVQGDLATPFGADHLDASTVRKERIAEVFGDAPSAEGYDREVFQQQEDPRQSPVGHGGSKPTLQRLNGRVGSDTQVEYGKEAAGMARAATDVSAHGEWCLLSMGAHL
jgi:hypothetical protein